MNSNQICDRIKSRRRELGLTLHCIGKEVGVTEATIQRYETGEIKNLKQDTIEKLAKVLNVTPSYLMGWDKNILQDTLTDNFVGEEFTKAQLDEIENYKRYVKSKGEISISPDTRVFVDKLIKELIKNGIIKDENNIDKKTVDMIMDAVRQDLIMGKVESTKKDKDIIRI